MRTVEIFGEMGDGGGFIAVGRVGYARVEVVELDAQLLAAFEVIYEGLIGLRCACLVRVRKVDQIRAVGDYVLVLIVCVVFAICVEAI